jgi:hypothetical protein
MIKIERTIVQEGPHLKRAYKASTPAGDTPKDLVRYHIDSEVGDIFDLLADMSKMIWLLNRKIEGAPLEGDIDLEQKLKERMQTVDDIVQKYYPKA